MWMITVFQNIPEWRASSWQEDLVSLNLTVIITNQSDIKEVWILSHIKNCWCDMFLVVVPFKSIQMFIVTRIYNWAVKITLNKTRQLIVSGVGLSLDTRLHQTSSLLISDLLITFCNFSSFLEHYLFSEYSNKWDLCFPLTFLFFRSSPLYFYE